MQLRKIASLFFALLFFKSEAENFWNKTFLYGGATIATAFTGYYFVKRYQEISQWKMSGTNNISAGYVKNNLKFASKASINSSSSKRLFWLFGYGPTIEVNGDLKVSGSDLYNIRAKNLIASGSSFNNVFIEGGKINASGSSFNTIILYSDKPEKASSLSGCSYNKLIIKPFSELHGPNPIPVAVVFHDGGAGKQD